MATMNLSHALKQDAEITEVETLAGTAEVAYFEHAGNIVGHVATSNFASFTSLKASTVANLLAQARETVNRELRRELAWQAHVEYSSAHYPEAK